MTKWESQSDWKVFIVDIGVKGGPFTKSQSQEMITVRGRKENLFEKWVGWAQLSSLHQSFEVLLESRAQAQTRVYNGVVDAETEASKP